MGQPAYYTRTGRGTPPGSAPRTPPSPRTAPTTRGRRHRALRDPERRARMGAALPAGAGRPDLVDDPRFAPSSDRVAHREELNVIVAARFARWTARRRRAAGRGGHRQLRSQHVARILPHPVLEERHRWQDVHPGRVRALLPPSLFGAPGRMDPGPRRRSTPNGSWPSWDTAPTSPHSAPTAPSESSFPPEGADSMRTSAPRSAPSSTWCATSSTRRCARSSGDLEHANTYPEALIEQMKELGVFGLGVPEPYGGGAGVDCRASRWSPRSSPAAG